MIYADEFVISLHGLVYVYHMTLVITVSACLLTHLLTKRQQNQLFASVYLVAC